MNLWKLKMSAVLLGLSLVGTSASAQDLKSILAGVAKAVVGDKATTAQTILGTWSYVGPDCTFESDKLLAQAGGEAAAVQVEKKLATVYEKLGMTDSRYIFNADSTYSFVHGGRTTEGTYTFDVEAKTITMKTKLGISTKAYVTVIGTSMSLLFNADKLMTALKALTSLAGKVNSTASTVSSLAENYDGLLLGFELKKQ
ncbi:MAG: DUF4923 family protein [Rikenella sp.]|nr:DUF4923 family protein [Rikenella sp.]